MSEVRKVYEFYKGERGDCFVPGDGEYVDFAFRHGPALFGDGIDSCQQI